MLTYSLLKNNAGIMICGDYLTLRSLHSVLWEINDASVLVKDKEGCLMNLAFEVRKAYEGQRSKIKPPEDYPEIGVAYGFKTIWPELLFNVRLIRESLAFFDSTKTHQAVTYELEALIENALKDNFKDQAPTILSSFNALCCRHPAAEQKLYGRSAVFCGMSKPDRKSRLSGIMLSLDASYDQSYRFFYKSKPDLLPPDIFEEAEKFECPDPRW